MLSMVFSCFLLLAMIGDGSSTDSALDCDARFIGGRGFAKCWLDVPVRACASGG
jgi:hypothetical protein